MSSGSYRQILRSTSIIGGSSVLNIFFGLVKVKVAALILGPTGIGLIGLLNNLMQTAANIASFGMGTIGTRQIAEAAGEENTNSLATARRALFWGTLALATIGAVVFWLLRSVLATHVLNEPGFSNQVGWLALGVAAAIAGGSQGALLNGLRRIGDIARVTVYSSALASLLSVGALLLWKEEGLIAYLLLMPITSFVVGFRYIARLPRVQAPPTRMRELAQQWRALASLGGAFMLAGLVLTVGQLVVRTMVQRDLGPAALGQFESAWILSMTYIAFVLRAMGTDYYPRLTSVINDRIATNKLVNEQTEVALLLASPILLAMMALAPWIIELLFSSEFVDAAPVLRWQILGDILKIISWPMGFIMLAAGEGRNFLITDSIGFGVFILLTWVGLPWFGIEATGMAFFGMYVVYLPIVYWLARRRTGYRWNSVIVWHIVCLISASVLIKSIAVPLPLVSAILGILLSATFAMYAIFRLSATQAIDGPIARLCARVVSYLK